MDAAAPGEYRAGVHLVTGFFSSQRATLSLKSGRLVLTRGEETLFDTPVAAIERVMRPDLVQLRPGLGNLQVTVGGTTYRISFPTITGFAGRTTGRAQAIQWERALHG